MLKADVLIVEGNFLFAESLKTLLEKKGFEVCLAFSTGDARLKAPFADAVICSTSSTDIDFLKIKAECEFSNTPCIPVSDNRPSKDAEPMFKRPFSIDDLAQTLCDEINRARGEEDFAEAA